MWRRTFRILQDGGKLWSSPTSAQGMDSLGLVWDTFGRFPKETDHLI